MKKFIALLLCLVIFVPVLGTAASAESGCDCLQLRQALTELSNTNGFFRQLLARIELQHSTHAPSHNENANQEESEKEEAPKENGVSDYEKRVVELVNVQREKHGLEPLTLSEQLSDGARLKSKDMHDNKYFSHTSPTYGSPFDMMKSLGITYRTAGENIAMGYSTPEAVVNAWMNSEGHRANILNASYTEIGVGYIADGHYYTQWFRG